MREDIAWPAVAAFHLDEYVGMPLTHPASILQRHADCHMLLDKASAALLPTR